jgi:hypothetical protein
MISGFDEDGGRRIACSADDPMVPRGAPSGSLGLATSPKKTLGEVDVQAALLGR